MQWDLAKNSLGDSPKGSRRSLGTCYEIVGRKPKDSPQECRTLPDWRELDFGFACKPLVSLRLDRPYHRNTVAASGCRWLNCPGLTGKLLIPGFRAADSGKPPRTAGKPPRTAAELPLGRLVDLKGSDRSAAVVDLLSFDSEKELAASLQSTERRWAVARIDGVRKVPLLVGADAKVLVHEKDGFMQKDASVEE
ncbi:hypothetical protein GW17_00011414 [Ensete ventricosum]|nr:hypothetical protein GW17_00011414 [Ensete ventricosum]